MNTQVRSEYLFRGCLSTWIGLKETSVVLGEVCSMLEKRSAAVLRKMSSVPEVHVLLSVVDLDHDILFPQVTEIVLLNVISEGIKV